MNEFSNMHIIHRGNYSYKYPENSIPAFRESLSKHKIIELDLHILKDNTVIVFHDDNLKRMCGVDIEVKDLTYEELLKYNLKETIYKIPTFDEVLTLVGGHVPIDIELKHDVHDHRLENEVINKLKTYKGEYYIKSFDPKIVKCIKRLRRKYKLKFKIGLLINNKASLILSYIINPDFIAFNYKNINKPFYKCISKRKPTLLYTIKTEEELNSLKDFKGGYIVENYESVFKN